MQTILIKQAKVVDPHSKWHNQTVDILVENGVITNISQHLDHAGAQEMVYPNLHVSPGFFDPTVHFCDPGDEHKEDIYSGTQAATAGGYTGVGILGITHPPVTEKTRVEYLIGKARGSSVKLVPIGCVSQKNEGKELAELYDMYQSGACGFYDGKTQINTGILSRALDYGRNFNAVIFSYPDDKSLAAGGLMHEGSENIKLGLKGIPAIAEELGIIRDAYLAGYHGARVHAVNVSTAGAVEQVKKAKLGQVPITAQCSIHHLFFTDADLQGFDSNLKIHPPLRSAADRDALIQGLKNGTIDTVTSDHTPQDVEAKKMEFDLAEYGAIGLETCFAALNTCAGQELGLETMIDILAVRSRKILNLDVPTVDVHNACELTLFDPEAEFMLTKELQKSRAYNNPYLDKKLKGKIYRTVHFV